MSAMNWNEFQWMNESCADCEGNALTMEAPALSDFFCGAGFALSSGSLPSTLANAPFYYTERTGDFVLRAKVHLDFQDVYDSATLMVMGSDKVWGKLCFEKTDFGTTAVVSVVTNGVSDDANGCNVTAPAVWLQIARSGNGFGLHYSLDGERFDMVRFFSLPVGETVKVGFVAQAPTGNGGKRFFENCSLEAKTVENLRAGK